MIHKQKYTHKFMIQIKYIFIVIKNREINKNSEHALILGLLDTFRHY